MNCAKTLFSQVGEVAKGVGKIVEYVSGDDRLVRLADAVIKFSEFLLGVLPSLIDAVNGGIDIIKENEKGAMLLILLFEYVKEIAPEIGENVNSIIEAFRELTDLIQDLLKEKAEKGEITVGTIIREILEHGDSLLDYSVRITKAFSFGRCSVYLDDVAFTVEDVGDDLFSGPYKQSGEKNGHPMYVIKMDNSRTLEFSTSAQRWTFVKRNRFNRKTYVYRSSQTPFDYPLNGWAALDDAEPPMPEIVPVRPQLTGP
jgi:hypothetical protein